MFSKKYSKEIMILDGGFGRELQKRGISIAEPLWSARPLLEDIEAVYKLHLDYINAGSDVITANTFGLKPNIFKKAGLFDKFEEYYKLAIDIAKKAREDSKRNHVHIATSLPVLTDSYKYDQVPDSDELFIQYKFLLNLAEKYPTDILLAETLSTSKEAFAIINNIRIEKPLWISFTVNDEGDLRNGEKIEDVLNLISQKRVDAFLVNCSSPESISKSINKITKTNINIAYGGYANLFHDISDDYIQEKDSDKDLRNDLSPDGYFNYVKNWLENGATIVGGCCGVGPKYIRRIGEMVRSE